jgi:hypothetical protein
MGTRDRITISAINALPIAGPPVRQEIARLQDMRGKSASNLGVGLAKTCPACGGHFKVKILKYWCDPVTDIITPADTIEQCDCGWTGVIVEHERPF